MEILFGCIIVILIILICLINAKINRLFNEKHNDSVDSQDTKYISGITNLIKEIGTTYINITTPLYTGRIKTFFPDGTEKIIWESDKSRDISKIHRDLNIRFKLLCKYYDLNENGECSDDRFNFIRAFNTNENNNKQTNNDIS